jgi:DNA primase
MTTTELKKYIYDNKKIEFVLEEIGCRNIVYHPRKDYYSCSNARGGDCNNHAAINIKNNTYLNYRNYTRDVSYDDNEDLISLVQYNMEMDFMEAFKYLHKILGLKFVGYKPKKEKDKSWFVFTRYSSRRRKSDIRDFDPMDEEILLDFVPYIHIDIFREGIIGKTIKKFGLGYSYKWNRTIFPIRYWLDGRLMGYNARTSIENYEEFDIKKYYITPGLKKEINLYGLWENYSDIQKANYIVVFEAEKSVLKRDSRMDPTGVALEGHFMSEEQVRIILGTGVQEVVIAMDNDVPIEEVWSMCEKFYRSRKVSYIWDKWGILKEKDSPADASNKMYNFLFKYRIIYGEKEHREYLKRLNSKKNK